MMFTCCFFGIEQLILESCLREQIQIGARENIEFVNCVESHCEWSKSLSVFLDFNGDICFACLKCFDNDDISLKVNCF